MTRENTSINTYRNRAADARYRSLERVTGIFGLLLTAVTFRLWLPQDVFPQVPLLSFAADWPGWLDYASLAAAMVGLVAMTLAGQVGSRWSELVARLRVLYPLAIVLAVVLDQHRLQPWAYQFSALAIIYALCGAGRGLALIRILVIGIYAWSAVGKFDFQFVHTVGTQMIHAVTGLVGLAPDALSPAVVRGAAMVLPLGEAIVAVLLLWPAARRVGVVLAIVLHLTLILILGPFGLAHQPGVLVWNAFFAVQAAVLFWPVRSSDSEGDHEHASPTQQQAEPYAWLAGAMVALMLLLPVLERFGRFDHWLSWALYAPHSSRATVYVRPGTMERLPESLVSLVRDAAGSDVAVMRSGGWVRLPIDRWSLATLGVPIYPQDRFQVGVALAIARQAGLDREIRVDLRSASDRFSGEREMEVLLGRPALQRAAEGFVLSAQPRAGG